MSSVAQGKRPVVVDDDDLDEFDDLADQFGTNPAKSAPKPPQATTQPPRAVTAGATAAPAQPVDPAAAATDELNIGDDFARQLAEGMAALMREIAVETEKAEAGDAAKVAEKGGPAATDAKAAAASAERDEEFRKTWEKIMEAGMSGALGDEAFKAGSSKEDGKAAAGESSFQESVRKAMEKMKVNDEKLQGESQPEDMDMDKFAEMLANMTEGGGDSDEDIQKALETMMAQLMSKEVLYEPLKELHDKFPAYLKENDATLSAEDKTRYVKQQEICGEIVAIFESPSYSEENEETGLKVVNLMNDMQSHGSPPSEIMGPMPPGLDLGPDGLPKLPEGCNIQ